MKLAVIYDSKTGNTKQAAEWIAAGMERAEGIEARCFHIDEIDEAFVREAKGAVIGCPVYAASMTAAMRGWLQTSAGKLDLAGKLGGAFATQQYTHGGAELAMQGILTIEMVQGMLCYSGGASWGRPVIHIGPVAVNGNAEPHNGMEFYKDTFMIYGERFAKKAAELFG